MRVRRLLWLTLLALVGCTGSAPAGTSGPLATPAPRAAASASAGTTAATAPPAALTPLRVASSGLSGNIMVPWAALEGGYFAKYGLDVAEIADIGASTTAIQTLLARDIDVAIVTANPAIEASLKGGDLVTIGNYPPGNGYALYAPPDVRSVDELRGKIVGANQVGSATYYAVDQALREHGLQVGRDVQVLSVGGMPAQLAALQQGQIQAAALSSPTTARARQAGFVLLKDLNHIPYNAGGPVVRREMMAEAAGRATLLRFMQASVDATARLRGDREFAFAVLGRYLKLDDPEMLDDVWQSYLPKRAPHVVAEGIPPVLAAIADRDPSARDAQPARFYDNSLVEELERSGVIDALYR